MSIFCRIGIHKWENVENETKITNWQDVNNIFDLLFRTRKCKRCHKKQKMRNIMSPIIWDNVELTKKEKRGINIDKLLNDANKSL